MMKQKFIRTALCKKIEQYSLFKMDLDEDVNANKLGGSFLLGPTKNENTLARLINVKELCISFHRVTVNTS